MVYIYTLSDPTTFEVRYVGKTINLKHRLECHINKAKSYKGSRHVLNWIQSLLKQDLKPIMTVVDTTELESWVTKERYWIKHFKTLGSKLCNHTEGGESNTGYKASSETKEKHRLARLGYKTPDVTKQKIRATLSRPVICIETGEKYASIKEAQKASGVPKTTFHRKFHAGDMINQKTYKYDK